jgi:hypothetical protein
MIAEFLLLLFNVIQCYTNLKPSFFRSLSGWRSAFFYHSSHLLWVDNQINYRSEPKFNFKSCALIVSKVERDFDPKLINITHDMANDGVHDTVSNFTLQLLQTLEKSMIYIQVYVPQDKQDEKYRKLIVKTRIDIKKMFDGVNSNFVSKMIMENLMRTIDIELKFPLKPVKQWSMYQMQGQWHFQLLFQAMITLTNFSLSDKFLPIPEDARALINLRVLAKTPDQKLQQFLCSFKIFVQIKRK